MIVRAFGIVLFVLVAVAACGATEAHLPLRRQCIVEVKFEFDAHLSEIEHEALITDMGRLIGQAPRDLGLEFTVSFAVPRHDRSKMYLQFHRGCEHRVRKSGRLIEYVQSKLPHAPRAEIGEDEVNPGVATIDVHGLPWAD